MSLSPRVVLYSHAQPKRAGALKKILRTLEKELNVRFVFPDERPTLESATSRLQGLLADASLVVFDVSEWNPTVAYELGIARGLGKPFMLAEDVSRQSTRPLPRDLHDEVQLQYKTPAELRARLRRLIQHQLGGPHVGAVGTSKADGVQPPSPAVALAQDVVDLLREKDDVGLRELARRERRELQMRTRSLIHKHAPSVELGAFDAEITPALERYLGYVLPLIDHYSPLLRDELRVLGRFSGETFLDSGPAVWVRMPFWLVWWLTYTMGAVSVSADNFLALRGLFDTRLTGRQISPRRLALIMPDAGGIALAEAQLAPERYWDPTFIYLNRRLRSSELMERRYPDLMDEGVIERRLSDYSFLVTLLAGRLDQLVIASWASRGDGAVDITNRLSADEAFRTCVSDLFDLPATDFEREAPKWLAAALGSNTVPGGFTNSSARLVFRGSTVWEA
jgi:hypothetical protein